VEAATAAQLSCHTSQSEQDYFSMQRKISGRETFRRRFGFELVYVPAPFFFLLFFYLRLIVTYFITVPLHCHHFTSLLWSSVIQFQHRNCSVCMSFETGWATTMRRLLGPKIGNSIKCLSQTHSNALLYRESNQGFATFRLLD